MSNNMEEEKHVADDTQDLKTICVFEKRPAIITTYIHVPGVERSDYYYYQRTKDEVINELRTMQLVSIDDIGLTIGQEKLIVEGLRELPQSNLTDVYQIMSKNAEVNFDETRLCLDMQNMQHELKIHLLNLVILKAKLHMISETIEDIIKDKDKDSHN